MATITLKNVPDDLYAKLKKSAAIHRRSINGEAITRLQLALATEPRDPKAILAELEAFRKSLGNIYVTDEDLNAAKRWGRP